MTTLKNLNFETLKKDAENFTFIDNNRSRSYLKAYPEFIDYFKNLEKITEHHLIISSHFVYGWMPTILKLDLENKTQVLSLLNEVKKGHFLSETELGIFKIAINNSLVGASKLLHFVNPHNYAIWDSRIYRYLTKNKTTHSIGKVSLYLEYLKGITSIAKSNGFNVINNKISKFVGYEISSNRAIEMIMFEADKASQLELK